MTILILLTVYFIMRLIVVLLFLIIISFQGCFGLSDIVGHGMNDSRVNVMLVAESFSQVDRVIVSVDVNGD